MVFAGINPIPFVTLPDHVYEVAPLAVRVTGVPAQMLVDVALAEIDVQYLKTVPAFAEPPSFVIP